MCSRHAQTERHGDGRCRHCRLDKSRSGPNKTDLQNIGLNYTGKVGPVALKAELDVQMGKETHDVPADTPDNKFKGNQIVIEGKVPMSAVNVNFTVARGSGQDITSTSTDITANADRCWTRTRTIRSCMST